MLAPDAMTLHPVTDGVVTVPGPQDLAEVALAEAGAAAVHGVTRVHIDLP